MWEPFKIIELIKWPTDFSISFTFRCKLSAPWSTRRTPRTTHKKRVFRVAMFTGHKRTEQESLHVWSFIWKRNHLFCVNWKWNKIRPLCTLAWLALRCICTKFNLAPSSPTLVDFVYKYRYHTISHKCRIYSKLSFIMNPCRRWYSVTLNWLSSG